MINSFDPIAKEDALLLILGSMPGKISLQTTQYYAHPRNQFWPILLTLLNQPLTLPYKERTEKLLENRIALWDVLQSCYRKNSLDTAIDKQSMITNDFVRFFSNYNHIRYIVFNGITAEQIFHRQILSSLPNKAFQYQRLPSTSPAHATLSYAQKLTQWSIIHSFLTH